jgi:hypothetical protein
MIAALQSANLKLIRASEHINAIEQCVRRYARSKARKVITDTHGKETIHIKKTPPTDIAVLAGETLYQLRSTLDHLAFDLVKLNATRIQLPSNWQKRCEFPLLTHVPMRGNPPIPCKLPLPYNYFSKILPGITKAAFTFIESVQPYHGSGTPKILGWLAHLSNIDKHRHLNLTDAQVRQKEVVRLHGGFISVTRTGLKHGAEVQPRIPPQSQPIVDVKRRFTTYVTFAERALGDANAFTVQYVLQVCLQEIETVIIPAFDQLLN